LLIGGEAAFGFGPPPPAFSGNKVSKRHNAGREVG
jgi:hypothetical protein